MVAQTSELRSEEHASQKPFLGENFTIETIIEGPKRPSRDRVKISRH